MASSSGSDSEEEEITVEWLGKGRKALHKPTTFYDAVLVNNVEYRRYDCVYLYPDGDDDPYVGKIIRMWEVTDGIKDGNEKMLVRWFYRPKDIDDHSKRPLTKELKVRPDSKEVFISYPKRAPGKEYDGDGVENVNKLESIMKKVSILCTSTDHRNRMPSEEELEKADHYFCRIYDAKKKKVIPNVQPVLKEFGSRSYVQHAEDVIFNPPLSGSREDVRRSSKFGEEGGNQLANRSSSKTQELRAKVKPLAVGGSAVDRKPVLPKEKHLMLQKTEKAASMKTSVPRVERVKEATIIKKEKKSTAHEHSRVEQQAQGKGERNGQKAKSKGGVEVSRKRQREESEDPRKQIEAGDYSVKKARMDAGIDADCRAEKRGSLQVSKLQKAKAEPGKSSGAVDLRKLKETGTGRAQASLLRVKEEAVSGSRNGVAGGGKTDKDKREGKSIPAAKKMVDKAEEKLESQVLGRSESQLKDSTSRDPNRAAGEDGAKVVSREDEEERLRQQALASMSMKKRKLEKSESVREIADAPGPSNGVVRHKSSPVAVVNKVAMTGDAVSKEACRPTSRAEHVVPATVDKPKSTGSNLVTLRPICGVGFPPVVKDSNPVSSNLPSVLCNVGAVQGLKVDRNRGKVMKPDDSPIDVEAGLARKSALVPSKSFDGKQSPKDSTIGKISADAKLSKHRETPATEAVRKPQPFVSNKVNIVTPGPSQMKKASPQEESSSPGLKSAPPGPSQGGSADKIKPQGLSASNVQQMPSPGVDLARNTFTKPPPDKATVGKGLIFVKENAEALQKSQTVLTRTTKPSPEVVKEKVVAADIAWSSPSGRPAMPSGRPGSCDGLNYARDVVRGKPPLGISPSIQDSAWQSPSAKPKDSPVTQGAVKVNAVVSRPVAKELQLVSKIATGSNTVPVGVKLNERNLVSLQPGGASVDQGPQSVFKPQAWTELLKQAVEQRRALYVENIHPAIDSSIFQDCMKMVFGGGQGGVKDAKISPHRAPGAPLSASAYIVFTTKKAAEFALEQCVEKCLILTEELRPLRVTMAEAPPLQVTSFLGHISLPGKGRNAQQVASATSHPSQPNTLEFEMALDWRVLQEQHAEADRLLKEKHEEEIAEVLRELGSELA